MSSDFTSILWNYQFFKNWEFVFQNSVKISTVQSFIYQNDVTLPFVDWAIGLGVISDRPNILSSPNFCCVNIIMFVSLYVDSIVFVPVFYLSVTCKCPDVVKVCLLTHLIMSYRIWDLRRICNILATSQRLGLLTRVLRQPSLLFILNSITAFLFSLISSLLNRIVCNLLSFLPLMQLPKLSNAWMIHLDKTKSI